MELESWDAVLYCSHSLRSIALASSPINFWNTATYAAIDGNFSGGNDWSFNWEIPEELPSGVKGSQGPWRPKTVQSNTSSGEASDDKDTTALDTVGSLAPPSDALPTWKH
jgi:hypothetical protein